jgi:hypothetical protein
MDKIDITEPRFTQAEVLETLPWLKPKTLQNWVSRDVLRIQDPNPGRQAKRAYSGIDIIVLGFMARLGESLGIGPSAARELARRVALHATDMHTYYPAKKENGCLRWVIAGDEYDSYHRGYIVKYNGKHQIFILKDLGILRTQFPGIYVTVEIDFLILAVLDAIYLVLAGKRARRRATVSGQSHDDVRQLREAIKFLRKLSQPQNTLDEGPKDADDGGNGADTD